MLWSQRRNSGAHGVENLLQISALPMVEPRTLASRLPRTPPFSRLLRHAGGYSRTILNRVFSWSRLLVPPLSRAVLFPWWVPRSGMGSLLNFGLCLEPCHLRFFST